MFRSFSLRLAMLYTAAFSLAVVLLGLVTILATRAALSQQVDAHIQTESMALVQEFRAEGLEGLRQGVVERDQTPGAVDYGLQGPDGQGLAGSLAYAHTPRGWSILPLPESLGAGKSLRVLSTDMPGGYRLMVGDDTSRVEALDGVFVKRFSWALAGILFMGMIGGLALSRDVHRRLSAISATAEAIIDGDLTRRVPIGKAGDDLDRLAATFNRMLDRVSSLMESLKQVSTDIAHDLRTPLTRIRHRLEASLATSEGGHAENLEVILSDMDEILGTFAALLRIAQIEGGARRAAFQPTDLVAVTRTATEAFIPAAEDADQILTINCTSELIIQGDRELLTQMVVNLVENALRHAGPMARIQVEVCEEIGAPVLRVSDDGPGVPEAERDRLFDRFYRLERSRSTPGNGLGLALVAAIARLHRARVTLRDAGPGLVAQVNFLRD